MDRKGLVSSAHNWSVQNKSGKSRKMYVYYCIGYIHGILQHVCVCTYPEIYIHISTWYIYCKYLQLCTWYIPVYTNLYKYVLVCTCIYMCTPSTQMYIHVWSILNSWVIVWLPHMSVASANCTKEYKQAILYCMLHLAL